MYMFLFKNKFLYFLQANNHTTIAAWVKRDKYVLMVGVNKFIFHYTPSFLSKQPFLALSWYRFLIFSFIILLYYIFLTDE